jgi:transcriptional regulator with XRE-family HTH domain
MKKDVIIMKYCQLLKMIRMQNGLTQQQLADALGITRSAYCGYEIGRRSPDIDTLINLAEFYGITLGAFFENLDNTIVQDNQDFDIEENAWYLSKLTKKERMLIAKVRTMTDEDKDEVYNLAKSKVESRE